MAVTRHTVAFTGAQTAGLILDPTNGTRYVLHRIIVSATVLLDVRFFDEADADATILFRAIVAAGEVLIVNYPRDEHDDQDSDGYYRSANINDKLECTYAEASNARITIEYHEEAV